MLRARVENAMEKPFALIVSSALATDGKSVCAQGLAQSMAEADYRTLLIDIDHEKPALRSAPRLKALPGANSEPEALERALFRDQKTGITALSLTDAILSAKASKESVAELIAALRPRFDAIVIEAARLASSSIGVLFASRCDGLILSVREGRSVRSEDRAVVELVEREGLNFFGVVTVGGQTIRDYKLPSFKPQLQFAAAATGTAVRVVETPIGNLAL
jgi:Mrp family chromosome partitioning ATPase